jgi:acyl-CoA thioesterase
VKDSDPVAADIEQLLGIDGAAVYPSRGWGNRWGSTYGGYVAAILLAAFERRIPPEHSISMAQVGFVHPLQTELTGRLSTEVHRSGSAATALTGHVEQDGTAAAVGMAWAAASIEQPSRTDVVAPQVDAPQTYARQLRGDDRDSFVDREFDLRPVATPDDGTLWVQWIRLNRLQIAHGEPWPASAVGLVADMVGAGPFRAAALTLGNSHATLALDLTLHLAALPVGPWVLGVFHNVALAGGRGIGRGELYDESGTFVASITQQSLVRPIR